MSTLLIGKQEDSIIEFLRQKRLTNNTYTYYLSTIKWFLRKIGDTDDLHNLTPEKIKRILEGRQPNAKSGCLSIIRAFLDFLVTRGEIDDNPARGIKISGRKQNTEPKVEFFSETEERLLYAAMKTKENSATQRNRLMLLLAIRFGIRLTELSCLATKDINSWPQDPDGCLTITLPSGLRRAGHQFTLDPQTSQVFLAHCRKMIMLDSKYIFIAKQITGASISDRSVRRQFGKYQEKSGSSTRATSQILFYTWIARQLQSGVDPQIIATQIGGKQAGKVIGCVAKKLAEKAN